MTSIQNAHSISEFNAALHEQNLIKIKEINNTYAQHPTIGASDYQHLSLINEIRTYVNNYITSEGHSINPSDIDIELIDREQFDGDLTIKITPLIKALGKEYVGSFLPGLIQHIKNWDNLMIADVTQKAIYPNIKLTDSTLIQFASQIGELANHFGETNDHTGKVMIAEYSSPNAAKHLHAGHIRSTVIGHILANIYTKTGYWTHRLNHINDRGGFGELIEGYTRRGQILADKGLVGNDLSFELYGLYRQAERAYKACLAGEEIDLSHLSTYFDTSNAQAFIQSFQDYKASSTVRFQNLENGGEYEFQTRKLIVQRSLEAFDKFYSALDIKHDYVIGESFYETKGKEVVKEGMQRQLITQLTAEQAQEQIDKLLVSNPDLSDQVKQQKIEEIKSDIGSYVAFLDNFERYVVLRSDGASIYATRDLGCLKYRCENRNPSTIMYEVGQEQADHFNKLFETGHKFGWGTFANGTQREFLHISHGFYVNKDSKKKLSSRDGASNVLHLIESSIQYFRDKYQGTDKFGLGEIDHIATTLGKASIIINDIRKSRMDPVYVDSDIQKTIEGFEESGGAYLMYTLCRAKSLVAKSDIKSSITTLETIQSDLIKKLLLLPDIIQKSTKFHEPSVIIDYFYAITQKFNTMYATRKNMSENEIDMLITKSFITVAENIFRMCNVEPLDRM